ncbi:MAG: hypothetical protein U5K75_10650 [Ahrensia sp.]|nr:hypothetical protein [Ahrensia sp.]
MNDKPQYPHVPAAFINAIREEGTKQEACDYLQKYFNENCALKKSWFYRFSAMLHKCWPLGETKMTLLAESASSSDNAFEECSAFLISSIVIFSDAKQQRRRGVRITFTHKSATITIEASWKAYAALWLKQNPYSNRKRIPESEHREKANQIGKMAAPSILRDWVKSQVLMIELGAMKFDEVFMPHIMLPDGRRLIEHVREKNLLALPSS